jgi:F-type H+-transporting ATPase subunit alpha
MSVAEMGVVLFAANEGFLEDIEVSKVLDFEAALKSYMNSEQSAFMDEVNANGVYSDEVVDTMRKAIETFKSTQTW